MNGKRPRDKAIQVDQLTRGELALNRAKLGLTNAEIASELGVSAETIRRDILAGIARASESNRDAARLYVAGAVQEIEELKQSLWQRALNGELAAIDRYDKLLHRQALLLGAYPVASQQMQGSSPTIQILNYVQPQADASPQGIIVQAPARLEAAGD